MAVGANSLFTAVERMQRRRTYGWFASFSIGTILTACALTAGPQDAVTSGAVAFPTGYRDWPHVKSVVIMEGHAQYGLFGGIHHVYANDSALATLKDGGSFPTGAVLVFDLLEERLEDGAIVEGPRKVIGVMEKDSKRFPDSGGWGFEDFKEGNPTRRLVTNMQEQCLSCHESQAASDYVYSAYRR